MQAARRLQEREAARDLQEDSAKEEEEEENEEEEIREEDEDDNDEENGDEVEEEDVGDSDGVEEEAKDEEESEQLEEENNQGNGSSDLAKNIEIRRLSSTEDGDKIIEPTFHSPEKEAGGRPRKNPLENILKFVSGMEMPSPADERGSPAARGSSSAPGSPLMAGLKGRKGRQVQQPYSALPQNSPPPWVIRPGCTQLLLPPQQQQLPLFQTAGTILTAGGHHTINTALRPAAPNQPMFITAAPQLQYHQVSPQQGTLLQGSPTPYSQQPTAATVMQLIQTVNGPMLVPLSPAPQQQPLYQLQPGASIEETHSSSLASSQAVSPKVSRKGGSNRKRKVAENFHARPRGGQASFVSLLGGGQLPLLLSPGGQHHHHHQGLVSLHPFISQQTLPLQQQQQQGDLVAAPHQLISLGASLQQPPANILVNQAAGGGGGPPQHIVLSNGIAGGGPATPSALMAVTHHHHTQQQGAPVVYQQLPDGTLVQLPLQSAAGHQQMIQSSPTGGPTTGGHIFVNSGGSLLAAGGTATGGGQFIMTPQGLIHTIGALANAHSAVYQAAPSYPATNRGRAKAVRQPATKRPRRDIVCRVDDPSASSGNGPSIGAVAKLITDRNVERDDEEEEDEEDEEDDEKEGEEDEDEEEEEEEENESPLDQASMDETDTSFEEARPSGSGAKKAIHQHHRPASSSSIQSNKVDSSGLNATPPHQKDQPDFEQLRGGGQSADESLELDSSYLDMSRNSEEAAIEDEEEEEEEEYEETEVKQGQQQEEEEEESQQQVQQQQQQHVSSSVKKKKKKSADDYLTEQSILYGKFLLS